MVRGVMFTKELARVETGASVTRSEIESLIDGNGKGATKELLSRWGVPWPPPKGWKDALLKKADIASGTTRESATVSKPQFAGRSRTGSSFYSSAAWKRIRFLALERFGQRCMCCGWTPTETISPRRNWLVVDHIKSRRLHPDLELEISNLQVLCNECNLGKGSFSKTDFRQSASSRI